MKRRRATSIPELRKLARASVPTPLEAGLALSAALLAILAFPDFELWFLAWVSLVPLFLAVVLAKHALRAALLGWVYGVFFFYGTCWWLTYPMIRYGHISTWLAYPLLLLPVALVALFPAISCALLSRIVRQFGQPAICIAPMIWVSIDWLRYMITGQLWNALGYSQAFHPNLIQSSRWAGVYAVTFLILLLNSAIVYLLIRRRLLLPLICLSIGAVVVVISSRVLTSTGEIRARTNPADEISIIAIQPNVPMDTSGNPEEMKQLLERHLN